MKEIKIRYRKCKMCNDQFEVNPFKPLIPVCGINCAIDYQRLLKKNKEAKESRDKIKVMKEGLLTHKDYLKILQTVFNTYIRNRDKNKGCITCERPLNTKFDAGHFFSVGSSPSLRFNEDNVFGQCVYCNQHNHGSQAEYSIRLPQRIGVDRFNQLLSIRNEPLKLSIPEIKELITSYKLKLKNQ